MDRELISRVCLYLINNINSEITLNELENEFNYGKGYILKYFKAYTGYSIIEYIKKLRVLNSIDSLIFTRDTILKIALNNGFNSQEYYSESCKEVLGKSPIKIRKEFELLKYSNDLEYTKNLRQYLVTLKNYQELLQNMDKYIKTESKEKVKVKTINYS